MKITITKELAEKSLAAVAEHGGPAHYRCNCLVAQAFREIGIEGDVTRRKLLVGNKKIELTRPLMVTIAWFDALETNRRAGCPDIPCPVELPAEFEFEDLEVDHG